MRRLFLFCIMMLYTTLGYTGGTVNEFTLPNGLKVIHKEITENPLVTIQIFLRAGTINEKENQAGLANFTQMMLLQGTRNRSAEHLSQEIEDIGGNISSDIEYDYSTIGISLMDSYFDKAMGLLSDIVANPSFPETEIEKERYNILASIKSRQDQIFNVANDLFNRTFYGDHPYSWPDSGKAETVSKIKRSDLAAWHRQHFTASNMVMVVVGNVGLDRLKASVDKCFSAYPAGTRLSKFPEPKVPGFVEVTRKNRKFNQAYLMMGFPAPDLKQPDFTALKVLNALMGSRMSGILFTELREKLSLAYEVNSFYPSRKALSRFVIYLGLEAGNLALAKKRIREILSELKSAPVAPKELEETKNFIRGVYLLDHQTITRKAWNMGWWEITGRGYAYDDKYLDELMRITPAQLQKAAQKYFTDHYVQVEIIPGNR